MTPRSHAQLVELSREKGRERLRLAAVAKARRDQAGEAEHLRIAECYRREVEAQSGGRITTL